MTVVLYASRGKRDTLAEISVAMYLYWLFTCVFHCLYDRDLNVLASRLISLGNFIKWCIIIESTYECNHFTVANIQMWRIISAKKIAETQV